MGNILQNLYPCQNKTVLKYTANSDGKTNKPLKKYPGFIAMTMWWTMIFYS